MNKIDAKPPTHLAAATRRWWVDVCQRYVLEPHHVRILTLACEAWDRSREARAVLLKEGLTVRDRYNNCRPHPCVLIEKDSRNSFVRCVRELGLDIAEEAPRAAEVQPAFRRA